MLILLKSKSPVIHNGFIVLKRKTKNKDFCLPVCLSKLLQLAVDIFKTDHCIIDIESRWIAYV